MDAREIACAKAGPGRLSGSAETSVSRPARGSDKGLTLLETMIVVGLIGALAAIAAFYYRNWFEFFQFSSAVSSLNAALSSARLRAIGRQTTLPFVFEPRDEASLQGDGWGEHPYGKEAYIIRYPYQSAVTDAVDYGKMAFVYDPNVYTITVNTGSGVGSNNQVGSAEQLVDTDTTDEWKRTVGFNSRGFAVRSGTYPASGCSWSQKPFRFSIKPAGANSVRKNGIIFTVSPLGKITRESEPET